MITNIILSNKERLLLEDQKSHEEQCILKYENYENLANDKELKAIFRSNGQKEKEHLETINQLLSGKLPSLNNQPGSGQQPSQPKPQTPESKPVSFDHSSTSNFKSSDKDLCSDILMSEKYVSGTYDTAIFEFQDAQVRDLLNHIQKEEQKHGEAVFTYMKNKGMYTPK